VIPKKRSVFLKLLDSSNAGIFLILIGMLVVLVILEPGFLGYTNFDVIAGTVSVTALVGMSQMVIMAMGGLNLAVGALGGAVGVFVGLFMERMGLPISISIILAVLIGVIGGVINGLIVSRVGSAGAIAIGPVCFLTTLATTSIFQGFDGGISQGVPFYHLPDAYKAFALAHIVGIPLILIVTLIVVIILGFLYNYSSFGKQALALGGNIKAAVLSGVNIRRVIVLSFMISGILSAIAAILVTARLKYVEPNVGLDWLLFSFAIPLIGGSRLSGGKISVFGTFVGAIIIAVIQSALVFLNINMYWYTFIQGLIILFVVGIDRIRTINNERREHAIR
jgi:ribose transport system permease protein